MSKNLRDDELDEDTDSDDEDYVPEGAEQSADESIHDSGNEDESADEENSEPKSKRKRKHKLDDKEEEDEKPVVDETTKVKQQERTEELWSKFLSETKTANKPAAVDSGKVDTQTVVKKPNEALATTKKSLFEEHVKLDAAATNKPTQEPVQVVKSKPAGLAGLLDKISKKPKVSTLEKSKQDWVEFKETEKIGDELSFHSKGKSSYLERKAFLERTDYRQFELEKELRDKERKLRDLKK